MDFLASLDLDGLGDLPDLRQDDELNSLNKHLTAIHQIREETSRKDMLISTLQSRISELEAEGEVIKMLNDRIEELEEVEKEKNLVEEGLRDTLLKNSELQTEIAEVSSQLGAEKSTNERLEAENRELKSDVKSTEKKLKESNNRVQLLERLCENMKHEMDSNDKLMKQEIDQKIKMTNQYELLNDRFEMSIQAHNKQKASWETKEKDLQSEIRSLEAENKDQTLDINKQKTQIKTLEQNLKQAKNVMDDDRAKYSVNLEAIQKELSLLSGDNDVYEKKEKVYLESLSYLGYELEAMRESGWPLPSKASMFESGGLDKESKDRMLTESIQKRADLRALVKNVQRLTHSTKDTFFAVPSSSFDGHVTSPLPPMSNSTSPKNTTSVGTGKGKRSQSGAKRRMASSHHGARSPVMEAKESEHFDILAVHRYSSETIRKLNGVVDFLCQSMNEYLNLSEENDLLRHQLLESEAMLHSANAMVMETEQCLTDVSMSADFNDEIIEKLNVIVRDSVSEDGFLYNHVNLNDLDGVFRHIKDEMKETQRRESKEAKEARESISMHGSIGSGMGLLGENEEHSHHSHNNSGWSLEAMNKAIEKQKNVLKDIVTSNATRLQSVQKLNDNVQLMLHHLHHRSSNIKDLMTSEDSYKKEVENLLNTLENTHADHRRSISNAEMEVERRIREEIEMESVRATDQYEREITDLKSDYDELKQLLQEQEMDCQRRIQEATDTSRKEYDVMKEMLNAEFTSEVSEMAISAAELESRKDEYERKEAQRVLMFDKLSSYMVVLQKKYDDVCSQRQLLTHFSNGLDTLKNDLCFLSLSCVHRGADSGSRQRLTFTGSGLSPGDSSTGGNSDTTEEFSKAPIEYSSAVAHKLHRMSASGGYMRHGYPTAARANRLGTRNGKKYTIPSLRCVVIYILGALRFKRILAFIRQRGQARVSCLGYDSMGLWNDNDKSREEYTAPDLHTLTRMTPQEFARHIIDYKCKSNIDTTSPTLLGVITRNTSDNSEFRSNRSNGSGDTYLTPSKSRTRFLSASPYSPAEVYKSPALSDVGLEAETGVGTGHLRSRFRWNALPGCNDYFCNSQTAILERALVYMSSQLMELREEDEALKDQIGTIEEDYSVYNELMKNAEKKMITQASKIKQLEKAQAIKDRSILNIAIGHRAEYAQKAHHHHNQNGGHTSHVSSHKLQQRPRHFSEDDNLAAEREKYAIRHKIANTTPALATDIASDTLNLYEQRGRALEHDRLKAESREREKGNH